MFYFSFILRTEAKSEYLIPACPSPTGKETTGKKAEKIKKQKVKQTNKQTKNKINEK